MLLDLDASGSRFFKSSSNSLLGQTLGCRSARLGQGSQLQSGAVTAFCAALFLGWVRSKCSGQAGPQEDTTARAIRGAASRVDLAAPRQPGHFGAGGTCCGCVYVGMNDCPGANERGPGARPW